jgi:uncharacterized membrane protein
MAQSSKISMSEATETRQRSRLLLALAVSLALNCLAAGYLIGRGAALVPSPPAAAPATANSFGERLKHLPGEERQQFQRAMQPDRPAIRQARADLAEARSRLAQVMAAEPYDPEKMRQAFADVRAKAETLQSHVQDATAQALAAISAQSRRQLAGP